MAFGKCQNNNGRKLLGKNITFDDIEQNTYKNNYENNYEKSKYIGF